MVKQIIAVSLVLAFILLTVGCMAHMHKVGAGEQQGIPVQERQWYVLWGLVPINNVDSHAMAGGATDYTIRTEQSALDVIINIFTGVVTVYSRTVTVMK
jgi:hypothetical protein